MQRRKAMTRSHHPRSLFLGYEIVQFAMKWRHWGGASDEDILVQFGLSAPEYFSRLQFLLDFGAADALDPTTILQLREMCRTRLAPSGESDLPGIGIGNPAAARPRRDGAGLACTEALDESEKEVNHR